MKVVGLGEVMIRMSPPLSKSILESTYLDTYFGGAEYNVLTNLSNLGCQATFITTIPNNELGKRVLIEFNKNMVKTNNIRICGEKLGIYYVLLGNEAYSSKVIYNRKYSEFYLSKFEDYNFEEAFRDQDLFHVSGITAALNENTRDLTLKAIKFANKKGIKISYDSNYRSKLWTQSDAGKFLKEILNYINYAFLGILDMKYLLNMDVKSFLEGCYLLKEKYPNLEIISSTTRDISNFSKHKYSVNIYDCKFEKFYQTEKKEIYVKDRIGTGDAYVAGILYGILKGEYLENIAKYGLADAVLKHYKYGDNYYANIDEIENFLSDASQKIDR